MTLEKKFLKLICIAFVGIIIILPLSACSEKEFIDKDRFVMYAKNESFETHDLTKKARGASSLKAKLSG